MIDQEEIYNQCLSKDPNENIKALKQLKNNFSLISDKQKAWNNLIQLTNNKHCNVKYLAAYTLDSVFSEVPNKKQAWNDLHILTKDKDTDMKKYAIDTFISSFSQVPNKQQAWNDLIIMTRDEDKYVRMWFTSVLVFVFSQVSDKQQAWRDLISLIDDRNSVVRWRAAFTLSSVFSLLPYKQKAWEDLISLTDDRNSVEKRRLIFILSSVFSETPNKHQAWNDLCELINKKDSVQFNFISILLSAFPEVPDKQEAWSDLYRVITDQNYSEISYGDLLVISNSFNVLISFFSEIPNEQKAWSDLEKLSANKYKFLRTYANHSLGKISIYRASRAEKDEDYKKELEKAIEFFEKAAKESPLLSSPSQFCLPFYRSFHTIIFEKHETKEEVDKYLIQARHAINGSKSKKLLFRAIENLANALNEVQSLRNLDLEAKKSELDFYRQYCDRATELIKDSEKTAPYATRVLRKGLPILDRNLKELLDEIQKKAKIACKELKGTTTEEIACAVNREVQKWEISNPEEMVQNIEDLAYTLKNKVADVPENEYILSKIELMKNERDLNKQYGILLFVIAQIPTMKVITKEELDRKFLKLDLIYDKTVSIETKLDLIQKTLDRDLEKLDLLSTEISEREGELIQIFSKNITKLTENRDNETLRSFLEEVYKKESSLIEEIEKSSIPQEEKEESKSNVLNVRSVLDKIKHPIKSFGKNVTKEIVVTYAAEETVKLVFQLFSMATLGVPIPPQILNLISSMTKDLKN